MPYRPFEAQNCSIARTLAIVGERWTLLVMREVLLGRRRFVDIRRHTGIAPNILSDRLQTLVEHELLELRDGGEYAATPKGRDLNPVLITLMQWGDKHAAGEAGAPRVVVHAACDHDADPRLRCSHCDESIQARDLLVRPGPGANERQRLDGVLPAPAS
jgi:DNA-binding HxlR family transcriptional regulator